MESVLTEWLSLIVRWLHVIAGIAWIGSSFYFIHLDLSLKPRPGLPQGQRQLADRGAKCHLLRILGRHLDGHGLGWLGLTAPVRDLIDG